VSGPSGQSEVDASKMMNTAAAEYDLNAQVADEEFPSMEEAVMLSRGIRTSVTKSATGTWCNSLSSFGFVHYLLIIYQISSFFIHSELLYVGSLTPIPVCILAPHHNRFTALFPGPPG